MGLTFRGKQNVRMALATRFEGRPDVHYGKAQHFVEEASETGISKWTLTGPRPMALEVWGCDIYSFRDRKPLKRPIGIVGIVSS